jgi:glycosyltransferase involved in cell wall biosynthesis
MHILFVHQNYPAQFGHIAEHLVRRDGDRCTFVTTRTGGPDTGVERVIYQPQGGATRQTHYFSRTFENAVSHAHGVYQACKARPDLKPDLGVGHSGFGSTLFLREIFDCPIINYFEYYYRPRHSDLDFRPEFPPAERDVLRSYCRNAMLLLDLQNGDAGYAPTQWQRDCLPALYHDKVRVIFDGVDTSVWHRRHEATRVVGTQAIPAGVRVVTYISRGFESMRGFDIFMKVAKRILQSRNDVLFVVVGSDRVAYGGDLKHTKTRTFREYVLSQDSYDLTRFWFVGMVPPHELARILSFSDLHIYLTVPFVLSWSLFNALACGCTVLASATDPVREVIRPGVNGLLSEFYDVDGLAKQSLEVLAAPDAFRELGAAGVDLVKSRYSLEQTLPELKEFYESVARQRTTSSSPSPPPIADSPRSRNPVV